MKLLTNEQLEERARLIIELNNVCAEVREAVIRLNEQMQFMWSPVARAQAKYNKVLEKVDEWMSQVHADMEQHCDNASQEWRESEEGQQFIAWMQRFATEFEELRLTKPQDMELPDFDQIFELAKLPDMASKVKVPT